MGVINVNCVFAKILPNSIEFKANNGTTKVVGVELLDTDIKEVLATTAASMANGVVVYMERDDNNVVIVVKK